MAAGCLGGGRIGRPALAGLSGDSPCSTIAVRSSPPVECVPVRLADEWPLLVNRAPQPLCGAVPVELAKKREKVTEVDLGSPIWPKGTLFDTSQPVEVLFDRSHGGSVEEAFS